MTHFINYELASQESTVWIRIPFLGLAINEVHHGVAVHAKPFGQVPLQKSLIWGKLAGEEGSLAFEVQIPVEMDLICTYDGSLQQDGIIAEIWTQLCGYQKIHHKIILFVAFDWKTMYCFLSGRIAKCHRYGRYFCATVTTFILSKRVQTTLSLLQKLLQRSKQKFEIQTKVTLIKQISVANWEQKDWLIELCES